MCLCRSIVISILLCVYIGKQATISTFINVDIHIQINLGIKVGFDYVRRLSTGHTRLLPRGVISRLVHHSICCLITVLVKPSYNEPCIQSENHAAAWQFPEIGGLFVGDLAIRTLPLLGVY